MGIMASICCPKKDDSEAIRHEPDVMLHPKQENPDTKASLILSKYKNRSPIGKGAFGEVFLLEKDNKKYALKQVKKAVFLKEVSIDSIVTEKKVMLGSTNPFVVKMYECFQDTKYFYMIMEYCSGGQLLKYIEKTGKFSEKDTRFYTMELILGLEYLHNKKIIHRDIKPENILLDSDGHVKLTDFGLSKIVEASERTKSRVGTLLYIAPEILNGKEYDYRVDFWSVGCLVYEMLHGKNPFEGSDATTQEIVMRKIKMGKYSEFAPNISENAKDLIKNLLAVDPEERLGVKGISEIKDHAFFSKYDWNDIYDKKIAPPIKPIDESLKPPNMKSKFQDDAVSTDINIPNFTAIDQDMTSSKN